MNGSIILGKYTNYVYFAEKCKGRIHASMAGGSQKLKESGFD
jgi:hypothetical protein